MGKRKRKTAKSVDKIAPATPAQPQFAPPDTSWLEMVKRHPEHPALEADTIYALPDAMIDVLVEHVPGLLTPDDQQFELDLAGLSGGGFIYQRPFSHYFSDVAITDQHDMQARDRNDREEASVEEIRNLLSEELRRDGQDQEAVQGYFTDVERFEEHFSSRRWGYAGWLATHREFREDCHVLKTRWEARVREKGFPMVPFSFWGEQPPPVLQADRECYSDFLVFYKKWNVESLVTWELPIPMQPAMAQPSLYHGPSLDGGGLVIFAPWYLLRDRDIKLEELLSHQHLLHGPKHLVEWLGRNPKKWSYKRFHWMLIVFVLLHLAVESRYRSRANYRTENLDQAMGFACELYGSSKVNAETVKRVRQLMQRRIKSV